MSIADTPKTQARRPLLGRGLVAAALVGCGIAVGAGGLALASGEGGMGPGMEHGMGHGWGWHHHHGPRVGTIQRMVRGALDNVGATTAQEDKVHDIVAAAFTQLDKGKADREGERRQVLELMKAPTLDRAAFEKLRAQKVADMEARSKVVADALFDAASQLTPEQRTRLVGDVERRMEHGGWGGRRDRMDGPGRERGPGDGNPGDRGPGDRGPGGPDRG